jgi:serine/threonine protein kinase
MALLIARDVLRGLVSVHRDLGLVHRDLKPANVLFDDDGVAHIADFGCCSSVDFPADDQCGTLSCMAPERLSGEPHGPPSDMWSLALLVAQLLVGTMHPYRILIPEERVTDSFWCLVEGLGLAGGVDAIDEAVARMFDRYFEPFLRDQVPAMSPSDQEISHWLIRLVRRVAVADAQLRPSCATLLEDVEAVVAATAL